MTNTIIHMYVFGCRVGSSNDKFPKSDKLLALLAIEHAEVEKKTGADLNDRLRWSFANPLFRAEYLGH